MKRERRMSVSASEAPKRRREAVVVAVDPERDAPELHVLDHFDLESRAVSTEATFTRVVPLASGHPFLKGLSPEALSRVIEEMSYREYVSGHCFFKEGETNEFFSLIESGEVEVVSSSNSLPSATRTRGGSLGDECLFAVSQPSSFTSTAVSKVGVWSIDGGVYRFVASQAAKQRYDDLKSFFDALPWLQAVESERNQVFEEVLETSQILTFTRGETVLPEMLQVRSYRLCLPPFSPADVHHYFVKSGTLQNGSEVLGRFSSFASDILDRSPSPSPAISSLNAINASEPQEPSAPHLENSSSTSRSIVCSNDLAEIVIVNISQLSSELRKLLLPPVPDCTIHVRTTESSAEQAT